MPPENVPRHPFGDTVRRERAPEITSNSFIRLKHRSGQHDSLASNGVHSLKHRTYVASVRRNRLNHIKTGTPVLANLCAVHRNDVWTVCNALQKALVTKRRTLDDFGTLVKSTDPLCARLIDVLPDMSS